MSTLLRYDNVDWDLPFLLGNHIKIAESFIEKVKEIEDKNPVKYLHGLISCKWNGEEFPVENYYNFEFSSYVRKRQVIPVFPFSNYNITDRDLRDGKSNLLLDKLYENMGEVEVSSDTLYNYVKRRFPFMKIIASPVKSYFELEENNEVDFYNKLLDKYDRVILSPHYVKEKFLRDYDKFSDISRIEIIVNERCLLNCPELKNCINTIPEIGEYTSCPKNNMALKDIYNNSVALSNDEVDKLVNEIGIKTLRIKGRNLGFEDTRFTITNYMLNKFGTSSFFMYSVN